MDRLKRRSPLRSLCGAAALVLVVAFAGHFLRSLDLRSFAGAVRQMRALPLLAAALVNLGMNYVARAQRWGALLGGLVPPGQRPRFLDRYALSIAGQATNTVLPLRAGDALRAVETSRAFGLTLRDLLSVQLVEKVVEAVALATLALPAIALSRRGPGAFALAAVATAAAVALAVAALRRHAAAGARVSSEGAATEPRPAGGLRKLVADVFRSLRALAGTHAIGQSLLWSLLSDLSDVAMIVLCARAAALPLTAAGAVAVWVGVNLAIAVPATPGQVGMLEAGAVLVLQRLGASGEVALAVALAYHAVHLVPTVAGGLLALALRGLRPARLDVAPERERGLDGVSSS